MLGLQKSWAQRFGLTSRGEAETLSFVHGIPLWACIHHRPQKAHTEARRAAFEFVFLLWASTHHAFPGWPMQHFSGSFLLDRRNESLPDPSVDNVFGPLVGTGDGAAGENHTPRRSPHPLKCNKQLRHQVTQFRKKAPSSAETSSAANANSPSMRSLARCSMRNRLIRLP